jgi:subtilase family serine protease
LFSLPLGNTSSQTGTEYLNIIYNGPQPAVKPDEYHADADTQWSAAVAPGAVIDYVASESTEASSGLDLSAAYIVDNNLASVLVFSYSQCELTLGPAGNAFYNALWQQAAAQGITVVTPAGDSGAAGCDAFKVAPASLGKAVNGIGSTPYNVSVGGTEFYAPSGLAQYFSATNGANYQSVTGYIPEDVWNDTCTNPAILSSAPYVGLTPEQACNSSASLIAGLTTVAGSGGGASTCTQSDGVHPATCSGGYPKPVWQTGAGVPADGQRDTPDVALFASEGRTNSFYVVCQQDRDAGSLPCNLNYPYSDFAGYGGTSLAAPAFAGIMALAEQKAGARIGNPNYVLYRLAAAQRQAGTPCASTSSPAAGCIFHDITLGTNAMACVTGTPGCVTATSGDSYGILSAASA